MTSRDNTAFFVLLIASLITGLLIAVMPLASQFSLLRPELVCLLVIYWVMSAPQHLGVAYAWVVGLLQDIIEGTVWGGHALALSVIAYICLVSYQRIRSYAIWHQAVWVFIFVGTHQVIVNWVQGLAGYHGSVYLLLVPAVVSALCWPVVYLGLGRLRLTYRVYS